MGTLNRTHSLTHSRSKLAGGRGILWRPPAQFVFGSCDDDSRNYNIEYNDKIEKKIYWTTTKTTATTATVYRKRNTSKFENLANSKELRTVMNSGILVQTRSSADADNRLDAFSGQSRSTNMVPFHM